MNREQIDKLWEALENNDTKAWISIIGKENEYGDIESKSDEEKMKIGIELFKETMKQIDNGDFEYFKRKIRSTDTNIRDFLFFFVIEYSKHHREYAQELVEGREQLDIEITSQEVVELIRIIDSDDSSHSYAKACIEGKIKLAVELDESSYFDILGRIKDVEYIENVIKGNVNLVIELGKKDIYKLVIQVDEPQLYRDCLEGKIPFSFYEPKGFDFTNVRRDIVDFIMSIDYGDPEFSYATACIEGKVQLSFDFTKEMAEKLLAKIDEIDSEHKKIKEFINNDFELLYLCSPDVVSNIGNREWTEEYIRQIANKNNKMLHKVEVFDIWKMDDSYKDNSIIRLIKSTNHPEFIKDCIEGKISTFVPTYRSAPELIDADAIGVPMEMIGYSLTSEEIVSLIKAINEENYTRLCISGEISLSSPLSKRNKSDLLISTQNLEYITECIKNASEIGIDANYVMKNISKLPEAKKYAEEWLENWKELQIDGEVVCELIKIVDNDISQKIDFDKLEEILSMKDAEDIQRYLLDDVILKNMGKDNIDTEGINSAIEKTHEIFLTSTLPVNFKLFEFFKYHRNHNERNDNFYNGIEDETRDMIISRDLFRTLLESDNIQMRNFLELLHNGNIVLSQENLDSETSRAILLEYRDVLFSFAQATEDVHLHRTQDYVEDIIRIREHFNLDKDEDIGATLLKRYFKDTGLEYGEEEINIVESLLEIMNTKRREAHESNKEPFQLSKGDLIKGTSFEFVGDMLRNGIRSKEFLMKGKLNSDVTPLDTDFSEISEENLQQKSLEQVLDSTYTSNEYGLTYLVIKREDYENDEVSYTKGNEGHKTRYFRTAIGSTNISAIITAEWNDEYKYMLASNGFYIPVIDKSSGEVLFSIEDYEQIRQSMQGLSHFGISEYTLDETVYDEEIREQAKELRKQAEGQVTTEEKREAVIDFIRKNIGRELTTEMLGDISTRYLELIDTGSTGRGTNIPGDGDFDFMLKCANKEEQQEMIAKIKTFLHGNDKGGTGLYAIRYTDVEIPRLDEPVEVDITAEKKRLEVDYSSDLAIRDRLSCIRERYGEEGVKAVIDNIIVAKKILKENGIYKKTGSTGATELGGFGGIGVENWILQNGGSLTKAMQTFLEHAVDKDGNDISFSEFKQRYPIYDFGQNHRFGTDRHDHFVEGLSEAGFVKMKELFREKLRDNDKESSQTDTLGDSIISFTKRSMGYAFSDLSRIYSLIAQLRTHEQRNQQDRGEV